MKDRAIQFSLSDAAKHTESFSSLLSLLEFVRAEQAFWKLKKEFVSSNGRNQHASLNVDDMFGQISAEIEGWKDKIDDWDDTQLSQNLNRLWQNHHRYFQHHWIWSKHPFVESLVQCIATHGENSANGFLDIVAKNGYQNPQNAEIFKGYVYGAEYLAEGTDVGKRSVGESASLHALRKEFSTERDVLFSDVRDIKNRFDEWDRENQAYAENIQRTAQEDFEEQLGGHDEHFSEKIREWSTSIDELEKTYQEKLRLEKPATYWKKSARKYGIQGGLWTLAIVALVIVGIFYFREFFLTWLKGKEVGVELSSIQGIILYGSFAAVYAYLIRVFSRLAFSSFHLMRDSEEREQLTYLYLALTKEASVDEKSREIVLQSLFSRTETGLLSQEHGPTMPGMDLVKTALKK